MRRIAHISDLHFGREDPALVRELLADLRRLEPALVAVSGDLTQRARRRQFLAARSFLERSRTRKQPVLKTNQIDAGKLKTFGRMHRHECYFAGIARRVNTRHKNSVFQKVSHTGVRLRIGDQHTKVCFAIFGLR